MRHVPSRSQLYGVDLPGTFGLSGHVRSPTASANAGLKAATALRLVGRRCCAASEADQQVRPTICSWSAAVAKPSRRCWPHQQTRVAKYFQPPPPSNRCDWSCGHSRAPSESSVSRPVQAVEAIGGDHCLLHDIGQSVDGNRIARVAPDRCSAEHAGLLQGQPGFGRDPLE